VVAPEAVSDVEVPEQMFAEAGVIVTVGVAATFTVTVAVLLQLPVVPVTV